MRRRTSTRSWGELVSIYFPPTSLRSKKFIAYLLTILLLVGLLILQARWNYEITLLEQEPIFSEEFMVLQLQLIGILSVTYIGGQATLDAILGWVRGAGGKAPQVVVNTSALTASRRSDDPPQN